MRRAVHRVDAQGGVRLRADRVVDLGTRRWGCRTSRAASCAARMLRLSPLVSAKNQSAPSAPARRRTSSSVPSPRSACPRKRSGSRSEGVGPEVDDGDLVARPSASRPARPAPTRPQPTMIVRIVIRSSWRRARAPRSATGSRTTKTRQGAFLKTYGMVLPMAKSPPKRTGRAGPATIGVGVQCHRLVDERGADVAGLQELRRACVPWPARRHPRPRPARREASSRSPRARHRGRDASRPPPHAGRRAPSPSCSDGWPA